MPIAFHQPLHTVNGQFGSDGSGRLMGHQFMDGFVFLGGVWCEYVLIIEVLFLVDVIE